MIGIVVVFVLLGLLAFQKQREVHVVAALCGVEDGHYFVEAEVVNPHPHAVEVDLAVIRGSVPNKTGNGGSTNAPEKFTVSLDAHEQTVQHHKLKARSRRADSWRSRRGISVTVIGVRRVATTAL